MTTEGASFKEGTGGNNPSGQHEHEDTGAERIFNHTPDMIAPGDEDEQRINDPDAVFFQEAGNGAIIANELLNQIVDGCKRTDRTLEAPQE